MEFQALQPPYPPEHLSLQPGVAPSIVTLSGVNRSVNEDQLSQLVGDQNPGFYHAFLYSSCTCPPCLDPRGHPPRCFCGVCHSPQMHRGHAIFFFANFRAAEHGLAQIRYNLLSTLHQLHWVPHSLTIQHPNEAALLTPQERMQRLQALDRRAGPAADEEEPPPPPPYAMNETKKVLWQDTKHAQQWTEIVDSGALPPPTKRKRRRLVDRHEADWLEPQEAVPDDLGRSAQEAGPEKNAPTTELHGKLVLHEGLEKPSGVTGLEEAPGSVPDAFADPASQQRPPEHLPSPVQSEADEDVCLPEMSPDVDSAEILAAYGSSPVTSPLKPKPSLLAPQLRQAEQVEGSLPQLGTQKAASSSERPVEVVQSTCTTIEQEARGEASTQSHHADVVKDSPAAPDVPREASGGEEQLPASESADEAERTSQAGSVPAACDDASVPPAETVSEAPETPRHASFSTKETPLQQLEDGELSLRASEPSREERARSLDSLAGRPAGQNLSVTERSQQAEGVRKPPRGAVQERLAEWHHRGSTLGSRHSGLHERSPVRPRLDPPSQKAHGTAETSKHGRERDGKYRGPGAAKPDPHRGSSSCRHYDADRRFRQDADRPSKRCRTFQHQDNGTKDRRDSLQQHHSREQTSQRSHQDNRNKHWPGSRAYSVQGNGVKQRPLSAAEARKTARPDRDVWPRRDERPASHFRDRRAGEDQRYSQKKTYSRPPSQTPVRHENGGRSGRW